MYIYDGVRLTGIVNGVKEQTPLEGKKNKKSSNRAINY